MKNLFKVTPVDIEQMDEKTFAKFVHDIVMSYTCSASESLTPPSCFYYEGKRFDKDTPDEDWEWLNKQWENTI